MAECPLPKPNTRVRFPSPAPKEEGDSKWNPPLLLEQPMGFEKSCARNARRGEFAKQICASIASQAREQRNVAMFFFLKKFPHKKHNSA